MALAGLSCFQFSILLLLSSLISPTSCLSHHQNNKHAALFIFGDSLFDPGNNNYINTNTTFQANFWPYGESFFKYPTGRFCDGRLIPDFIAEYAKLPLIQPYLQQPAGYQQFVYGANFASSGAGALAETFPGMVIDLKTQLSYFKIVVKQLRQNLGDGEAKQLLSNAVYLFSIGSNDYGNTLSTNSSFFHSNSQDEYVKIVIGNSTAVIQDIYMNGGRKFGFVSLGPLGSLPGIRALEPENNSEVMTEITHLLKLHNKALSKTLRNLETQLKGFMYSNFNFYTAASERINNPSKYGFKEVKTACCGTGPYRGIPSCGGKRGLTEFELCKNASEYMFFDSTHPTEMANQQFAELMWSGIPNVTGPYNLKSLFERTH
ncbi:unnamed protein product [Ilex paraguariensis]|uniref:GDSL esterase/lipase 1-like n=1 Tax=Ilex paraguariensis TaxID=185542 RepID=A0ABC8URS9_9AQUA